MKKFLNISNHPSGRWTERQLEAAKGYGDIIDIPFPQIEPEAGTEDIALLAEEYLRKIEPHEVSAVMVQGEFTFSYALIKRLRKMNITVVAACTKRKVEEQILPDGAVVKNSIFEFCGFREYE